MLFKQSLIVIIICISPHLYGQSLPALNSTLDEGTNRTFPTLRLPSAFSYHILSNVTEFQFSVFISHISFKRKVQFLNTMEYSNIIHALEMKIADILHYGNNVLAVLANLYPSTFMRLLDLEDEPGGKKVIGLYLQDIEFHEDRSSENRWIIDNFIFGLITSDGQPLITKIPCNEECHQEIEEKMELDRLHSQILSRLGYSMSQSFEDLLIRENIPQNHTLTLYLKDLSPENKSVSSFKDIERINIGVIVEDDEQRFIREIDWIIEKPDLQYTTTHVQSSILTAFHESAHELVKRVFLSNDYIGYTSIEPALFFFNNKWTYAQGLSISSDPLYSIDQNNWLQKATVLLAGIVSERLLSNTQILKVPTTPDLIEAVFVVFNDICLERDDIHNELPCFLTDDFNRFNEWFSNSHQTASFEDSLFMREVNPRLSLVRASSHNILVNNLDVLIQLTRLTLQRGSLDNQNLQDFFQRAPVQRIHGDISILENYRYALLPDIGPDILDRNLSLLFSLDSQESIDKVRISSVEEILEEAEEVRIPGYVLLSIRKGPILDIEQNYAQGLPSLYLREAIDTFVLSLTGAFH